MSKYSAEDELIKKGYKINKKLVDSLQGCIWRVTKNDETMIIKSADKKLVKGNLSYGKGGKKHYVQENILNEASLLKLLSVNKNTPDSIIGFNEFFEDEINYYLSLEDGEQCFFEYVLKIHPLISSKKADLDSFRIFANSISRQMANVLHWLHSNKLSKFLNIFLQKFIFFC